MKNFPNFPYNRKSFVTIQLMQKLITHAKGGRGIFVIKVLAYRHAKKYRYFFVVEAK